MVLLLLFADDISNFSLESLQALFRVSEKPFVKPNRTIQHRLPQPHHEYETLLQLCNPLLDRQKARQIAFKTLVSIDVLLSIVNATKITSQCNLSVIPINNILLLVLILQPENIMIFQNILPVKHTVQQPVRMVGNVKTPLTRTAQLQMIRRTIPMINKHPLTFIDSIIVNFRSFSFPKTLGIPEYTPCYRPRNSMTAFAKRLTFQGQDNLRTISTQKTAFCNKLQPTRRLSM